jgi:aryl-alcohol dehydrogenase-like predicted oxidoreductase
VKVDDVLGRNGIADALDSMRSRGLARFTGFTGLGETAALHQVIDSGRFDVVQAYYSLLNPSAGLDVPVGFAGANFHKLINLAAEKNMGIVNIRVMAGGALGGKPARTGHAAPTVGGAMVAGAEYNMDEARAARLVFLLNDDIASLPRVAIRFALMHPAISTVLVGFSNIGQIEEAAGCSGKNPLSDQVMAHLNNLWSNNFGLGSL